MQQWEEEGAPASASGSLEQQGLFLHVGQALCYVSLWGEELHFQKMNRLFVLGL